jgi:hypothetical protein
MICTDLSWSITGSTIAKSYGRYDHKDWCNHKGYVCTWNLSLRDLDSCKPHFIAEVSVIVTI